MRVTEPVLEAGREGCVSSRRARASGGAVPPGRRGGPRGRWGGPPGRRGGPPGPEAVPRVRRRSTRSARRYLDDEHRSPVGGSAAWRPGIAVISPGTACRRPVCDLGWARAGSARCRRRPSVPREELLSWRYGPRAARDEGAGQGERWAATCGEASPPRPWACRSGRRAGSRRGGCAGPF
jgi:hypothetical protein